MWLWSIVFRILFPQIYLGTPHFKKHMEKQKLNRNIKAYGGRDRD